MARRPPRGPKPGRETRRRRRGGGGDGRVPYGQSYHQWARGAPRLRSAAGFRKITIADVRAGRATAEAHKAKRAINPQTGETISHRVYQQRRFGKRLEVSHAERKAEIAAIRKELNALGTWRRRKEGRVSLKEAEAVWRAREAIKRPGQPLVKGEWGRIFHRLFGPPREGGLSKIGGSKDYIFYNQGRPGGAVQRFRQAA